MFSCGTFKGLSLKASLESQPLSAALLEVMRIFIHKITQEAVCSLLRQVNVLKWRKKRKGKSMLGFCLFCLTSDFQSSTHTFLHLTKGLTFSLRWRRQNTLYRSDLFIYLFQNRQAAETCDDASGVELTSSSPEAPETLTSKVMEF